jgi:hypothetical protein
VDYLKSLDFDEIKGKRYKLLWRGSEHGFDTKAFHHQCDHHGNTVTIMRDSSNYVFGGYTPVAWENRIRDQMKLGIPTKAKDDSCTSFIFICANPKQITEPKKFMLYPEKKNEAIYCDEDFGPSFGNDLIIRNNCNKPGNCEFVLGYAYETDGPNRLLIGRKLFTVTEIEVYEIH